MNLHEDMEAFSELVGETARHIGLPQVYVEKDYWVTNALRHLAQSDFSGYAVFKGGTSLSKAYKLIHRFSEDIDLAVMAGDAGDAQRKKLLKGVEQAIATGLTPLPEDTRMSKGSNFRRTVYRYPRSIEGDSFGQASPELLIEVNAFSHPEPFETHAIQTLVADFLTGVGRQDLIQQYRLESFSIKVLSIRRTLVEKILGIIKDSYHDDPTSRLSNRIRHFYDICQILQIEEHRAFLGTEEFSMICGLCIRDEQDGRFDNAHYLLKPLREAPIFSNFTIWQTALEATYRGMFSELVYGSLPSIEDIGDSLKTIQDHLK